MHPVGALATGVVAGCCSSGMFTLVQNKWRIDDVPRRVAAARPVRRMGRGSCSTGFRHSTTADQSSPGYAFRARAAASPVWSPRTVKIAVFLDQPWQNLRIFPDLRHVRQLTRTTVAGFPGASPARPPRQNRVRGCPDTFIGSPWLCNAASSACPTLANRPLQRPHRRPAFAAENYPFCTIEPNVGVVEVPDPAWRSWPRSSSPSASCRPQWSSWTSPGWSPGASRGEGLGNQFLSHIRETDAIINVVRCFENPNVIHVAGKVDPIADIEVIETELALADLQTIEKGRPPQQQDWRAPGDKEAASAWWPCSNAASPS